MAEPDENPYRTDRVAESPVFVGRGALLGTISSTVRTHRNAIHAVMGGRGMGKSSFARRLQHEIGPDALTVVTSGRLERVTRAIDQALSITLSTGDPVSALADAPARQASGRVLIVLDEIEMLMEAEPGLAFLDNLREAYEQAGGHLGVVVLGGTRVRDLLLDKGSPFLRIAGPIHVLTGLSRDETAQLMRTPLNLQVPDEVVDALWAETAGHPWLLQMFMERAVERASSLDDVPGQLPGAVRDSESRLHEIAFPLWWDNLRSRGQEVYRTLVEVTGVLPRAQWVQRLGNDPRPWIDVLASTGLAALDEDAVIARGVLFRQWVAETHPALQATAPRGEDGVDGWLTAVGAGQFERIVVRALATWARATIEFPAAAVRPDKGATPGNGALQHEAFFQMHALVALLQHETHLTAEPEALSMRSAGRSDIKVRSRHDPTHRACVEFKIFGRQDNTVVQQVIGYAAPTDTFAIVVSVDRYRRPLRPAYEAACFEGAAAAATQEPPEGVVHPAFLTVHAREGYGPLRVWHVLVQLRDA
jgi:hypothetical protein